MITTSRYALFVIRDDGYCYSCGANEYGQLGVGDRLNRYIPSPILTNERFVKISCESRSVVGLTVNGEIYTWGLNESGQLGVGDKVDRLIPTRLLIKSGLRFVNVECSSSSVALTDVGDVYVWGVHNLVPIRLYIGPCENIFCGGQCAFAQTFDGDFYAWGWNQYGTLGIGDCEDRLIPFDNLEGFNLGAELRDGPVRTNIRDKFTKICVCTYTVGLTQQGAVYCWGSNSMGQLGVGDHKDRLIPTKILLDPEILFIDVVIGYNCVIGLTTTGELYSWGSNFFNQLGYETLVDAVVRGPIKISIPDDQKVVKIVCGATHVMCLTQTGNLYGWGTNFNNEINNTGCFPPLRVPVKIGEKFADIFCDFHYSLGVTETGDFYAWGDNCKGQLGCGKAEILSNPTLVDLTGKHILASYKLHGEYAHAYATYGANSATTIEAFNRFIKSLENCHEDDQKHLTDLHQQMSIDLEQLANLNV